MSRKSRINLAINLALNIGVLGLIFGVFLLINNDRSIKIVKLEQSSAEKLSTVQPTKQQIEIYNVAPDLPKYISIPKIKISNAIIVPLGLLKDGSIATPGNVFEAGWYKNSSKPGNSGAMFIYAHVSSWTSEGLFFNLKDLSSGDIISITKGDNTVIKYKVIKTKIYDYNNVDMNEVLSPVNQNIPGLNLMTCTGSVIKGTSEFNQRLVVFTNQIN